jgi:hypothetical protein
MSTVNECAVESPKNVRLTQQKVLERTNVPTFLTLFNNAVRMTAEMYR